MRKQAKKNKSSPAKTRAQKKVTLRRPRRTTLPWASGRPLRSGWLNTKPWSVHFEEYTGAGPEYSLKVFATDSTDALDRAAEWLRSNHAYSDIGYLNSATVVSPDGKHTLYFPISSLWGSPSRKNSSTRTIKVYSGRVWIGSGRSYWSTRLKPHSAYEQMQEEYTKEVAVPDWLADLADSAKTAKQEQTVLNWLEDMRLVELGRGAEYGTKR